VNGLNPVVNYNIGFKFIKGNTIVIQNAEVCYVGDPLSNIYNLLENDKYYVFDVNTIIDYESNRALSRGKKPRLSRIVSLLSPPPPAPPPPPRIESNEEMYKSDLSSIYIYKQRYI